MESRGTWLCPTPFDRERLLDMEARIAPARAIMYAALAVAFASGIPWLGWWIVLPLAWAVVAYRLLQPRIATSARPEYVIAATVVQSLVMLGVAIAITGGPDSPAIPLLLLPIVTLPARFSGRGVIAGVGVTIAVLLVSTAGVDPAGYADDPTLVNACVACCVGLAAFAYSLMRAEIEQRADAILDPLTGLLNRKALGDRFAELAEQAAMTGGSVALITCDLDRFKEVNDAHGHDRGDAVLKDAAYVLRRNLRSFELVYRLGGEEFLVVLPGVERDEAVALAERLRAAIEEARPGGVHVTVSLGVAAASGADVAFDPMFRRADEALYSAKDQGRNRVGVLDEEPLPDAA